MIKYCSKCDFPIDRCQCAVTVAEAKKRQEEALAREIALCGGARAHSEFTLEAFKDTEAKKRAAIFPKRSLYIYGEQGRGKSHLGTAIIRQQSQFTIKPFIEILREYRAAMQKGAAAEMDYFAKMTTGFLMIDDAGKEKQSEFSVPTLWEIVDKRWMSGAGNLIITSQFTLDGLAARLGDSSITSRIAGMCDIIKLTGNDYRLSANRG